MEVLCNIKDCGYNTGGMCFHDEYLKINGGQCSWLINNPNYRTRPPKAKTAPSVEEIEDTPADKEQIESL